MIDIAEIQDFAEHLFLNEIETDDEDFWDSKEELNRAKCANCGLDLNNPDLDRQKNYFCCDDCEENFNERRRKIERERSLRRREDIRSAEIDEIRKNKLRKRAQKAREASAKKFKEREERETKKRGGLTFLQWMKKLESERKPGYCILCQNKLLKKEFSGRKKVHSRCAKKWKAMKDKQNYLNKKERKNA